MPREKFAFVRIGFVVLLVACAATMLNQPAHAQSFSVIHNFAGGPDGDEPAYGLTIDAAGNIYGSTFEGDEGTGTIYKLRYHNSVWQLAPLYVFTGGPGSPAAVPYAGVIIARDGTLFGTTGYGGEGSCATWGGTTGCGTVFRMRPRVTACPAAICYWQETTINLFDGGSGGSTPYGARPIFDSAGNLYGTTYAGGGGNCQGGCGLVYELTPSGGGWTETVLYSFTGTAGDGAFPWSGVILDQAGNLYGTTEFGGTYGYGTIYELSRSGSGWTETILYNFQGQQDGAWPFSGLIFDPAGNLYGATTSAGSGNGGTIFQLSPGSSGWTLQTLTSFTRQPGELAGGPVATPIMDAAGNIYAATYGDGAYGLGSVVKLHRSNGGYTTISLHDFTGPDGLYPRSNLVLDANGNIYGMAASGGANGRGTVFEITLLSERPQAGGAKDTHTGK